MEPKVIFIVVALFLVTLYFIGPSEVRKKLSLKETGILFLIYIAVSLVVRTILSAFGM